MTDWGAHHIDIAHWAINSDPVEIHGTARMPEVPNGFNVAIDFHATFKFANGVIMTVADSGGDNGILFTGDAGRLFVNRGKITGAPVEALQTHPLPREDWKVYDYDNLERPPRAGKLDAIVNHMGNFFDCVQSRRTPVSDVDSSHRTVSTCHLGNISMRLGRPLKWDPTKEAFIDDREADTWLKREQRKGFETT
jgi:predicted dehydrogenase